ncbi:hypothetical protein H4I96_03013 [Botrytis cinerea]
MDPLTEYEQQLQSLEHENKQRQTRARKAKTPQNGSFMCDSAESPCLLDVQLEMLRRSMTSDSHGERQTQRHRGDVAALFNAVVSLPGWDIHGVNGGNRFGMGQ